MRRKFSLIRFVFSVLAVLSFSPPTFAATGSATIILVRHAEKAGPKGDVPLSAEGRERADLLAWMLKPAGVTHIFSSQLIRARETAAPLASATQVQPEIIRVEDLDALVARLKELPSDAVAVVVNHSTTVPEIIEKLGAGKIAPIEETDYNRLIVVVRTADQFQAVPLQYGKGPRRS